MLLQNGRANGALRKLGAVQEGILRRSVAARGEYVDQVLWSLLKDDWGDHWVSTSLAGPLMNQLPFRARLYVTAVIAAGALLFFARPASLRVDQPLLFLASACSPRRPPR